MKLKEKNFEILKGIDIEDNIVWSLSYKFLIWNFLISDKYTRIIDFNTKKEALEFQNKLLGIEIPFSEISFVKKEIYVPFEFPLDTKHRAYKEK